MTLTQSVSQEASVLVVDDNPLIINVVTGLLQSHQYTVSSACSGDEALKILTQEQFDLIICDVMMPKMDGFEFHSMVRDRKELSHIPFVFLTALGQERDVYRGHAVGADDYITKPFEPEQLLAVIRGKIIRSKARFAAALEEQDEYRKRVIHTLSHELRTPLVAINTGTEMLLDENMPPEEDPEGNRNILQAIQRGGRRLERMVNDFIVMQQIEAGLAEQLYQARIAVCPVSELMSAFASLMEEDFAEDGAKVAYSNICGDSQVDCDSQQILEILKRIAQNSMKFRGSEKELEVSAYLRDHQVCIEVCDRGIGFDPDKMRSAVKAFNQINREKLEQQGGGLGLAIASRYAQINQAQLEFESREGGGAVVRLVLLRN